MDGLLNDPVTLGVIGGLTALLAVVVYNFRKAKKKDNNGR